MGLDLKSSLDKQFPIIWLSNYTGCLNLVVSFTRTATLFRYIKKKSNNHLATAASYTAATRRRHTTSHQAVVVDGFHVRWRRRETSIVTAGGRPRRHRRFRFLIPRQTRRQDRRRWRFQPLVPRPFQRFRLPLFCCRRRVISAVVLELMTTVMVLCISGSRCADGRV